MSSLPLIGTSQAVSLGGRQLLPFSGNTVNVYTGTDACTGPIREPIGSCTPGSFGVCEPILWGQSALWREKLEVQGICGPAIAVF